MIGHRHNGIQHLFHRHMPQRHVEFDAHRTDIQRLRGGRHGQARGRVNPAGRRHGGSIWVDEEIDPVLLRVELDGFIVEVAQHLAQGEAIELDALQHNLVELGCDLAPAVGDFAAGSKLTWGGEKRPLPRP